MVTARWQQIGKQHCAGCVEGEQASKRQTKKHRQS